MKGKITMTISIACTALILTMIMFTQFKTVDETDITAIETMRETELRTELADWKEKNEEIEEKIEETESKIKEYRDELENDENSFKLLENEVKEAKAYVGYTSLKGEGITVTLKDTDMEIRYSDLLNLVNELNAAGAEAISINGERIVSMSDISVVNNAIILVNANRISSPYVVKAIGDKKYFESALTIKGGYIDTIKVDEREIEYNIENNIVIPAYEDEQTLKHATKKAQE